jgi:predicted kinase
VSQADGEPEPAPQPETERQPAAPASEGRPAERPSRRRRGRGGRGRGGARTKTGAAAATPATAAEPSAAEPVVATPAGKAPAAPAQPSKGIVVLAIGLPGSGKSSWFKRHDIRPLSSDLLRELLFDDAQEQRFQDLVFSNLRSMLKARLVACRPVNYVDATNLTPHDRHSWIKLAKDYGYDVQGVYFDVPVEVCLERNQKRERVVAEDVMRRMAGKLKAPTFEEGFSKITVVRVKQKEA